MAMSAITVDNLSKRYLLGHQSDPRFRNKDVNLRDAIVRTVRGAVHRTGDTLRGREMIQGDRLEEFWALKGISFEVKEGEVLGIIGRNGAGKSTLLKILSRITEPTAGRVTIHGRVASLLEVGTGFHAELSGRENIFLNGAILGMTRADIRKKFDEIVAFSEVERFLDTPVKRYSSGMYVRLAFAVAAHLEPEILIVDEVLAVGDAAFQAKCMGKMSSVAQENRTVLFVSHNMGAVKTLTTRSILLESGVVTANGPSEAVVENYLLRTLDERTKALRAKNLEGFRRGRLYDNPPARILEINIANPNEDSDTLPEIELGSDFTIEITLDVERPIVNGDLCVVLMNSQGERVTSLVASDRVMGLSLPPGEKIISLSVPDLYLAPGRYFAEVWLDPMIDSTSCDAVFDYPLLSVVNSGQVSHALTRPWGTVYSKKAEWSVLESAAPVNAR
ncbi:MAG: ATP-binding cassette domain-containing protein [Proteobacteria bacterium]|nr:ATP-binding cassette domain-containing protein [Pseudomonadota bacterium]